MSIPIAFCPFWKNNHQTFLGIFPLAVNKAMHVIWTKVNRAEWSVRAVEGPCKCEWGSLRTMNSVTPLHTSPANSQRAGVPELSLNSFSYSSEGNNVRANAQVSGWWIIKEIHLKKKKRKKVLWLWDILEGIRVGPVIASAVGYTTWGTPTRISDEFPGQGCVWIECWARCLRHLQCRMVSHARIY